MSSNLVNNGDMELDSVWIDAAVSPDTNERSNEQAQTGTYSRKVITSTSEAGIKSNDFSLTAGGQYTLSCWLYSVSGDALTLRVREGDDGSNALSEDTGIIPNGVWTEYEYTFTPAVTGTQASFIVIEADVDNNTAFYIDNVVIAQAYAGGYRQGRRAVNRPRYA
jgi:hypothetical protein